MAKSARKYIKLSVPLADTSVLEWLSKQDDMSLSIRALIRSDIERNGMEDMFCRGVVPQSKRGRPSNAELQYRAEQEQNEVDGSKEEISEPKVLRPIGDISKEISKGKVTMDDEGNVDPESLLGL